MTQRQPTLICVEISSMQHGHYYARAGQNISYTIVATFYRRSLDQKENRRKNEYYLSKINFNIYWPLNVKFLCSSGELFPR